MRTRDITAATDASSERLDHALWWLQRWISGSMNDSDWEWPEAESMSLREAFQTIGALVGNARSATKPVLWRFLTMPEKMAKQVIRTKRLPPNPKHPFQSFSGKKSEALAMMDHIPEGHVPVLVSTKPDPTVVPFGMADLLASKHPEVRSWIAALDHWYHQDEVMVQVTKPLPLLSAEILDAQMEEVREANLWEAATGRRYPRVPDKDTLRKAAGEGFDISRLWFHGTRRRFDTFRSPEERRSAGVDELGPGIYLTSEKWIANHWARERGVIAACIIRKGPMFDMAKLVNPDAETMAILSRGYFTSSKARWGDDGSPDDPELFNWVWKDGRNRSRLVNDCLWHAGFVAGYKDLSQIPGQIVVFKPEDVRIVARTGGRSNMSPYDPEAKSPPHHLSESRNAPLYHFTTFRSLTSMAYHDALGLGRHDGKPPQVSLTRDPRLPLTGGLDTVLVLDQRALGTRYRMTPTYGDSRTKWAHDPQDESEERVTGRIKPLHRYLRAVHVPERYIRDMQEAYGQSLHKREKDGVIPGEWLPRAADLTAYLVRHSIPVYPRDPDDPMWHRRKVSPVKFPSDGLHEARKPKTAPFFFVLVRGHEARVEPEGESLPDETDGWEIVWDSARSIEDGYAYAAKFHGAFPRDDRFKPQPIQEPKTLYRSVSLPELVDIFRTSKIVGKSNVAWNSFDSRRNIVFFGDELNDKLIWQGEEVERQAQVAMGSDTIHREWDKLEASKAKIEASIIRIIRDEIDDINNDREADEMIVLKAHEEESLDNGSISTARDIVWKYLSSRGKAAKALDKIDAMRDAENALRKRYRAELDARMRSIKAGRSGLPYTSAVIVTQPLGKGLHYSKAHGVSGMGEMDEYGFAPGQVTLDDVTQIIFIKDGKAVRSTDVEQARGLVDEIAPKLG